MEVPVTGMFDASDVKDCGSPKGFLKALCKAAILPEPFTKTSLTVENGQRRHCIH